LPSLFLWTNLHPERQVLNKWILFNSSDLVNHLSSDHKDKLTVSSRTDGKEESSYDLKNEVILFLSLEYFNLSNQEWRAFYPMNHRKDQWIMNQSKCPVKATDFYQCFVNGLSIGTTLFSANFYWCYCQTSAAIGSHRVNFLHRFRSIDFHRFAKYFWWKTNTVAVVVISKRLDLSWFVRIHTQIPQA
jgi:hypothetical protein